MHKKKCDGILNSSLTSQAHHFNVITWSSGILMRTVLSIGLQFKGVFLLYMFLVSRSQLASTCALDSACSWQIGSLKAHSIHGTGVRELKLGGHF